MVKLYDCDKCIHKTICRYRCVKLKPDFKESLDKLSKEISENMDVYVTCKYYEEAYYNGTIK